jgi:hypothetical protein
MNNCQDCGHECHCEGNCNEDNCTCENCDCKDWPDNPAEVGHF